MDTSLNREDKVMENIELTLMNGVLTLVKEACKNYRFTVPKCNSTQEIKYHEFDLPEKIRVNKDNEYYPFLVIRPIQGQKGNENNNVTFYIQVGIYDENQQDGFRSVYNVINSIKKTLIERTLIGTGELDSLKWEGSNGETQSYYRGEIIVTYNLPQIFQGGWNG